MASPTINPSFLSWKQQDHLIMSVVLSSFSAEHLIVDYHKSYIIWWTLEKALASPSNTKIIQFHGAF
jgi:hypothetical protein